MKFARWREEQNFYSARKGIVVDFFTSFFSHHPSVDKELIVTSSSLLIGTRMKFTSYRRKVPYVSRFSSPPYIYIYIVYKCNTFSSLFFTFVSERVIRSPFLSSPPLSLPFFPSPPSDRFRPPFSPSEPRMAGTKRERKRAEQGERRKRIRQVASGGSFTDREQRSFERRWKINLFFERSLEKE